MLVDQGAAAKDSEDTPFPDGIEKHMDGKDIFISVLKWLTCVGYRGDGMVDTAIDRVPLPQWGCWNPRDTG